MACECWSYDGLRNGICIYRCDGTRERDICHCDGDKSKCDFYENVREKGNLEKKANQIIKIDGEPSTLLKGLYDIIDRSLKESSVKSVEIDVQNFIQIKINRAKGE